MLNSNSCEKVYECRTCGNKFSRRTYLQLHEKIHGEKRYKCSICDKAFSQPAGLWIHKKHQSCLKQNSPGKGNSSSSCGQMQSTEDSEKQYKCDVCNKGFSQKHLLTYHKRIHSGESPFSCTICGKKFRGAATLKFHERTHTGQRPYKCIFCVKAFTQLGPLKQHCKNEHQTEKIYECEVCETKFEKFWELSAHKKIHFGMSNREKSSSKTGICTNTGESETSSDNVAKDGSQNLNELMEFTVEAQSETSGKGSSGLTHGKGGKYHTSGEEENSTHASLICALKDDCDGTLDRTEKDCFPDSDKSMKVINETDVETSVKESLLAILKKKENRCISGKQELSPFTTNKVLKHVIDVSPSEEDQTLKRTIKQDQNYENASLDGKKYKCNLCNQEFSQAHVLKYHKRTHTGENPHLCTICNKSFRTPGALTVHHRTHNGQKPYKCIFCSKGFTQRGPLKQHCRRLHHSDQIYECDVCKERFEKYRDLSSHKHVHFDAPFTMVKPTYDEENAVVKFEDTAQPVQEMKDTLPEVMVSCSVLSPDIDLGDCDTFREDKSQLLDEPSCQDDHATSATNPCSTYQEAGNMDVNFSDEFLSIPGIKQEKKEDCECSTDSGIFADTSPYNINFEWDKHESDLLYEVCMQPIEMKCEESEDYLSTLTKNKPHATRNVEFSQQNPQTFSHHVDVDGCSKTKFNKMSASDDDRVSSCSRETAPEIEPVFSSCSGDLSKKSTFDNNSVARSSCQFSVGDRNTHCAQLPGAKHKKWEEVEPLNTSKFPEDNSPPSIICYNNGAFPPKSTNTDLQHELTDYSSSARVNSEVFCYNDKVVNSRMDPTLNFTKNCGSQKTFAKINGLACPEISISRRSFYSTRRPQCICLREKTNITLDFPPQHPTYDNKTSGTQYICLECDVLPSSSHLV